MLELIIFAGLAALVLYQLYAVLGRRVGRQPEDAAKAEPQGARARQAERRGGDAEHVVLDTAMGERLAAPENDVLRVHEALDVLAQADARLAQVVEMRYFGGLSEAEIAEGLGVSERTVRRDWERARLLLLAALD